MRVMTPYRFASPPRIPLRVRGGGAFGAGLGFFFGSLFSCTARAAAFLDSFS
jgi:hypothetical protein